MLALIASVGMLLEDRHVLVGRGVEDDLRPVLLEDLVDLLFVRDIGQHGLRVVQSLEGELVQQRLVAVERARAGFGSVLGHLAGDLAADRAAGTSDDDSRTGEVALDVVGMDGCVRPAEKVGDVEVTKAARAASRRRARRSVGGPSPATRLRARD